MVPTYRNSSSSSSPSFPFELNNNEVHDLSHHPLVNPNNYQVPSSSSYNSTCQTFFNNHSSTSQDQIGYYHSEFYHQTEVEKYGSRSGSSHDHQQKKHVLKLSLWKKGNEKNQVKNLEVTTNNTNHKHIKMKLQDQKPLEADHYSSNNNIPIRVCSDCKTTKTPLWRSGPQGPKSLCNACGIRQRKARRAMAAAAAAAKNETNLTTETSSSPAVPMKIKVQQQQQQKQQKITTKVNTNHVVPFKKRCKFTNATTVAAVDGSSSSSSNNTNNNDNNATTKKLCFEDFFVNLSNNLAFHRVFPQDEKEAAILLMAISSGLVHG